MPPRGRNQVDSVTDKGVSILIALSILGLCIMFSLMVSCELRVREMTTQLQQDCIKAGGTAVPVSPSGSSHGGIVCIGASRGVEKQ